MGGAVYQTTPLLNGLFHYAVGVNQNTCSFAEIESAAGRPSPLHNGTVHRGGAGLDTLRHALSYDTLRYESIAVEYITVFFSCHRYHERSQTRHADRPYGAPDVKKR